MAIIIMSIIYHIPHPPAVNSISMPVPIFPVKKRCIPKPPRNIHNSKAVSQRAFSVFEQEPPVVEFRISGWRHPHFGHISALMLMISPHSQQYFSFSVFIKMFNLFFIY